MRFLFPAAVLATFVPAVISSPTVDLRTVQKFAGPKKENSYIVTLKNGASRTAIVQKLKATATVYDKGFFNGFAAELTEDELNQIRANADVERIEEDGIVTASACVVQSDATWNLERISQRGPAVAPFTYGYDSSGGAGVDIYIVDTGIRTTHTEFGGRARWGATFGGYPNADGNGHGTSAAGLAGGARYGVAKRANLIAVKVLSDAGAGAISDIVSGLNWVLQQAQASGRPSIVNMSLGGSANTALDNAVTTLTNAGVHVAVAAGNSNSNVSNFSPARVPSAITVAAIDMTDAMPSYSNWGAGVDVLAPGAGVTTASHTSDTAFISRSGTSQASPHVAGVAALLISARGNQSPDGLSNLIKSLCVPAATVPAGTTNCIVNTGCPN